MLIGLDTNQQRILAKDAIKGSGYLCPACKKELIVKQGEIKIWHYAHKYLGNCWWENESEDHLETKIFLHDLFSSNGYDCEYEVVGENYKTDLLVKKCANEFAIEVIASPISIYEIIKRTYRLNRASKSVLWILSKSLSKKIITTEEEIRINDYVNFLHRKIYFGRIYGIHNNKIVAIYPHYRTETIVYQVEVNVIL